MDERLTLISSMVKPCQTAADIGADHGYLICSLVEQGGCVRGIAADINPKPLEKARRLIAARGLQDHVSCLCTDGLHGIDEQDAVIIAGMGGELIAEIIEGWEHRKNKLTRFYLQPMTKAERLRGWLYTNGYHIEAERCCVANLRPYSVIEAVYSGQSQVYAAADLYLGAIDHRAGEGEQLYCRRVRAGLKQRLEGLLKSSGKEQELEYVRLLLTETDRRISE